MTYLSDADSIRFVRYFAGEATPDDRAEIERWAKAVPGREVQLERLQRLWETCGPDPLAYDSTALWGTVRQMIDASANVDELPLVQQENIGRHSSAEPPSGKNTSMPAIVGRRGAWYTAAGIAMGVAAIVVGWHIGSPRFSGHQSTAVSAYVTGNGQRANITLTDGTTVALDVASRLEVPADYSSGNHTLRLTGAALFTVAHHGDKPFTVTAGDVTARVLGTSFVVRHYANETTTTVAVRDGKVAVRSAVLTAAHQAVIGSTGVAQLQPADPAQFSFAAGVLTLQHLPLLAAIAELDRWYDVDIRLGDPALVTRRLTGEYAAGSIADLMDILEGTYNVRVLRDGRVLTLFPR